MFRGVKHGGTGRPGHCSYNIGIKFAGGGGWYNENGIYKHSCFEANITSMCTNMPVTAVKKSLQLLLISAYCLHCHSTTNIIILNIFTTSRWHHIKHIGCLKNTAFNFTISSGIDYLSLVHHVIYLHD